MHSFKAFLARKYPSKVKHTGTRHHILHACPTFSPYKQISWLSLLCTRARYQTIQKWIEQQLYVIIYAIYNAEIIDVMYLTFSKWKLLLENRVVEAEF